MPSKTPAQARLMAAVAHGWHKPGGGGPPVKVAKEFNQADKGSRIMTRKVQSAAMGGGIAPTGVMPTNTGAPTTTPPVPAGGGAPMARNTPTLPAQASPRASAALAARPAMPAQAFGGNRPAMPTRPAMPAPATGNVGGNFAMPTQAKTSVPGTASFAKGGPVLGRTTDFMKTPDRFRQDGTGRYAAPKPEPTEDVWGKGQSKANPEGRDKSEKPVKPRG